MTCFKNRLSEILREKDISQLKLYKMTGIAPGTISNIVHGKQIPYQGWITKISEALETPAEEIFPDMYKREA